MPDSSNYPFPPRLIFFVALRGRAPNDPTTTTVAMVRDDPFAVLHRILRLFFPDLSTRIEVSLGAGLVVSEQGFAVYGPPYVAPDWKQDGDDRTMYIDLISKNVYGEIEEGTQEEEGATEL